MTDKISDQPEGSTSLEDISGLLRDDITTRGQLDEAENLNIVSADDLDSCQVIFHGCAIN